EHDLGPDDAQHCCGHLLAIDSVSNLYGEDGRLRISWLKRDSLRGDGGGDIHRFSQLEEYRYDALGRRVWTRNIRGHWCGLIAPESYCVSAITRAVWDGNQMLYE